PAKPAAQSSPFRVLTAKISTFDAVKDSPVSPPEGPAVNGNGRCDWEFLPCCWEWLGRPIDHAGIERPWGRGKRGRHAQRLPVDPVPSGLRRRGRAPIPR